MATDDDLTCDSTDSDFFKFLMVYGPSEIVSLVFSAVSLVSVPLLLYSIIWFDNFGSDKKRTFINRLVSSFCAALIEMCFTIQLTEFIRLQSTYNIHQQIFVVFKALLLSF